MPVFLSLEALLGKASPAQPRAPRAARCTAAWRGSPFVELIRGLLQQTSKLQLTRAACNPLAELR